MICPFINQYSTQKTETRTVTKDFSEQTTTDTHVYIISVLCRGRECPFYKKTIFGKEKCKRKV